MTIVTSKPRMRKLQPSQPTPEPVAAAPAISSWASLVRGPDDENSPPQCPPTTTDAPDVKIKMESTELTAPLGASPIDVELPLVKGPSEEFGAQRFKVIGEGKKVRRCADCTKPLTPSQTGRFCTNCEASAEAPQRYIPPSRRRGACSTSTGIEPPATVRLTNLGDATEQDVRDAMAAFGSVSRVSVPRRHADAGCGRGFAFVTFRAASAAHAVLAARLCVDHLIWHAELSEDKPWTPY